jgi:hypothetical protein
MAAVEHRDLHQTVLVDIGRKEMPEELRDCPMGEFPMLAPELISMLRNKRRACGHTVEPEPPGFTETRWSRLRFTDSDLGNALIELRCCADEIHDAGFEPDDEILAMARSRVPATGSLNPKSVPA